MVERHFFGHRTSDLSKLVDSLKFNKFVWENSVDKWKTSPIWLDEMRLYRAKVHWWSSRFGSNDSEHSGCSNGPHFLSGRSNCCSGRPTGRRLGSLICYLIYALIGLKGVWNRLSRFPSLRGLWCRSRNLRSSEDDQNMIGEKLCADEIKRDGLLCGQG